MTISKTKLLEWVRQQQKDAEKRMLFASRLVGLSARMECWNLLIEAIEAGDFDDTELNSHD